MAKFKKGDRVLVRGSERYEKPLTGTIVRGHHGWWVVKLDERAAARCLAGIEPYRGHELKAA